MHNTNAQPYRLDGQRPTLNTAEGLNAAINASIASRHGPLQERLRDEITAMIGKSGEEAEAT